MSNYPRAFRTLLLMAATIAVAVPARAQTAAGGVGHTVILKSDGMSDLPKFLPHFRVKLVN